jgi:tartrate dehydratase beta subunit/fumarate hydratase class I family protein
MVASPRSALPIIPKMPVCCSIVSQGLPKGVDFDHKFIYYVGPVEAVSDEVIGPAGPTTASEKCR